jgi:hypothetical protein
MGSARQGGVATRQVLQMVEVRTRQAQRVLAFHPQQTSPIQLRIALAALGALAHPEDHQLPLPTHRLVGAGRAPDRPRLPS